jgi:hypothetical protein
MLGIAVGVGCYSKQDTEVKGISYDLNHDMYSGCPRYPAADKPLKLNSSIVQDPAAIQESLNSKPCLMTMRVSEDFLNGYRDNLNGRRPRVINRTQEYADGYNLAAKDMQEGVSRRLEAIVVRR